MGEQGSTRSENNPTVDMFGRPLFDDSDKAIVDAVQQIATARGVSTAQVAMAWVLKNPVVSAPIIGATKSHHLTDAVAALDSDTSPRSASPERCCCSTASSSSASSSSAAKMSTSTTAQLGGDPAPVHSKPTGPPPDKARDRHHTTGAPGHSEGSNTPPPPGRERDLRRAARRGAVDDPQALGARVVVARHAFAEHRRRDLAQIDLGLDQPEQLSTSSPGRRRVAG
jgi:hypothetical protein